MLGFRPVGAEAVAAVDKDLVEIDKVLRGYEAAWDAHVDAWLVIKARRPACSPGPSHLLAQDTLSSRAAAQRPGRRCRCTPTVPRCTAAGRNVGQCCSQSCSSRAARGVLVGAHDWPRALPGRLGPFGLLSAPGAGPGHRPACASPARRMPLTCSRTPALRAPLCAADPRARPPALWMPATCLERPGSRHTGAARAPFRPHVCARRWARRSGCTAGARRPSTRWRPRAAPA